MSNRFVVPFADVGPGITPFSGAKLEFFQTGTSTPKDTFSDASLTTPNSNPVISNNKGVFPDIFLASDLAYKVVLKDADDVQIWEADPVTVIPSAATQITYNEGSANAVDRTVTSRLQEYVSVKDFGAVGDGTTDDTTAINDALASQGVNGGTIFFPEGTYRVTSEIVNPSRMTRIIGTGKRFVYPGPGMEKSSTTTSTIFADHSDRNLWKFVHTSEITTTFTAENIGFITNDSPSATRPTACFGFDVGGTAALFQRDFTFDSISIHNFTSAFDMYDSGSSTINSFGIFKASNCVINRNDVIARNLNGTQWNGFYFSQNEAGQNGTSGNGGIDIAAHAVGLQNNVFEGQNNPVTITGVFRSVLVENNYFEACTGTHCVHLSNVIGTFNVGPNLYIAVTADHKVLMTNTGLGTCIDPYWYENTVKTAYPLLGIAGIGDTERVLNNTLSTDVSTGYGIQRTDVELADFLTLPELIAISTQRVTINQRSINPINGFPMPAQEYITTGTGVVVFSYTIAGSSGDYVVMSWLLTQIPDASGTANPFVTFLVNGTTGNGGRDYNFSTHTTLMRQGQFFLLTCAIKLTGSMTSLTLNTFPFGVSPAASRSCQFLRPIVYTVDDVNKIVPYVDPYVSQSVTAAPTFGTWNTGDTLFNSAPAAGQGAFVCTASGTPGTFVFT